MITIIVAGGTGGHIYPALAILNKIKEKEENSEFLYIGTENRMEKDIVPSLGIPYVGIEMEGLNRKHIFSNIKVCKKFLQAVKKAKKEIQEFHPDIVIGAGGYITAPVLYAAHKLKVPILIHEQNSIPGISNKFIGRFADKICVSLPNSVNLFPKNKVVYTGNPRSEEIISTPKKNKESLGFDKNKKLVVIVMGSLGSTTMTEKIKELLPAFEKENYQVLVITGKRYYDDYKEIPVSSNVKVLPFMDDLIRLLKDTDLLVSRAGASTIAEITAIGLPAILVPSPYVTNNHQYKNAKELENAGACKIIEEKDFSKETVLAGIEEILKDEKGYQEMAECSKKLGIQDSATRIYEEAKKIIENR